ncbi:Glycosylphosphatidylinositol-mannosyltransferase I [Trypanosoma melophagium]|uniref:Glycosylphosphatidylinositol-mannosyltransferase I n=1 Tax=Trypanosoma melophagium TaxID=715481 RepID=UPI00351A4E24|nr:Glycosylphosphatidylinositol-mannosyltransferase I [Trypanosoma melophagium]
MLDYTSSYFYLHPGYLGAAITRTAVFPFLLLNLVLISHGFTVEGTTVPCNLDITTSTVGEDIYHWGFRGGGYHMQFDVEFPLALDTVRVSLELPHSFFFDAAEVEQLYSLTTVEGEVDITNQYTPLSIASSFFFDIEAPAFRIPYKTNEVNFTFTRLPSAKLHRGKGLLLLPIHARYDEVDTVTPFSIQAFFKRDTFVERCIPAVMLSGGVQETSCYVESVKMENYSNSSDSRRMDKTIPTRNCQHIPVGILSSLPFVYTALGILQCVGALIVILSLL